MARRQKKDSGGSWLDTYADLVTLLLTFFVLLFSMSNVNVEKYKLFQASFSSNSPAVVIQPLGNDAILQTNASQSSENSFNAPSLADSKSFLTGAGAGGVGTDALGVQLTEAEKAQQAQEALKAIQEIQRQLESSTEFQEVESNFNNLQNELEQYIIEDGLGGDLQVERVEDTIILRIGNALLFGSGSAELSASAKEMLASISVFLEQSLESLELIVIEGHTDDVPISTYRYPDNWALSADRASNVLRYINGQGVPFENMSAMAYGETKPIASNDTPEGRMENRRVCFNISRKDVIEELLKKAKDAQVVQENQTPVILGIPSIIGIP